MTLQVTDAAPITGVRETRDGYWTADAAIARTGIQLYAGAEMGRPQMDVVRVFRPEESVFDNTAMASFAHRPVTVDHPNELVTAANWRQHSVGMTGDNVARDGDHIRVPLALMDSAAIAAVRAGKRELSCGYTCEIDWTPGVTDSGEQYDAVQRGIVANHLAIVAKGRAGATCRIGDSWTTISTKGISPDMPDNLRTVQVDGISIQTTDQGAQMIERLQKQLSDAAAAVAAKDSALAVRDGEHAAKMSAKDGEIAGLMAQHNAALQAKDGEIAAMQSRIPNAAAMDALLAERADVIDTAAKFLGKFDPKGKSAEDIRRMAVVAELKDAAAGKDDNWIGAAFTTLATVKPAAKTFDKVAHAIKTNVVASQMNDSQSAHAEMVAAMSNAYRGARS